jgi:hypothetical protein
MLLFASRNHIKLKHAGGFAKREKYGTTVSVVPYRSNCCLNRVFSELGRFKNYDGGEYLLLPHLKGCITYTL